MIFVNPRKIPIINQFKVFPIPKFEKCGGPDSHKECICKGKIVVKDVCKSNCRAAVVVAPIGTCLVTAKNINVLTCWVDRFQITEQFLHRSRPYYLFNLVLKLRNHG